MKGITVEKPGARAQVTDGLEVPEPGEGQILVKTIYAAINPVDAFMADMGLLVVEWPLIPGCEAGGIVVKAGKNAISPLGVEFKEGDEVSGCTRLGFQKFSPWQEYFLMDAHVTFPNPKNVDLAQSSTIGSGALTAFCGIFDGLKIPLVDSKNLPKAKDEWVLVFGGASAVGKFAAQTLKAAGYKVVTTCSAKSFDLLKSLGADATVDYKKPDTDQITAIKDITGGKLDLMFDAVSVNNALATQIFSSIPASSSNRYYTTTNSWEPAPESKDFTSTQLVLGPIGRPEATELNKRLNEFIPVIVKLIENGTLKVGEYAVEGEGVEGILKAWEVQKSGKAGSTKVIVKVADA